MKTEEHKKILDAIKTATEDTVRTENLLTLETDYAEMTTANEKLSAEVESLTQKVDEYAKLNNELFLSAKKSDETKVENRTENKDEPPKKMEYSDLNFDED